MALCGALFVLWFLVGSPSRAPSYRDYRKKTEKAIHMKAHMTKLGKEYMSDKDMLAKTNSELEGILNQKHQGSWGSDNVVEVKDSNKMDPAEALFKPKEKTQAETEEVTIAGRKKMPKQKSGGYEAEPARYPTTDDEGQSTSKIAKNDPGKEAAREELRRILLKSPSKFLTPAFCLYIYSNPPNPYLQSSSSRNRPVPTPNVPKTSCSTRTRSPLPLTSSNWTR